MERRAAGILMHITSLPSPYGIGDLGPAAFEFIDFLTAAKQHIWQVLPLNPIDLGMGNSPYSASSAFAGNELLISPDRLVEQGFLSTADLSEMPKFPTERVEYEDVAEHKQKLLHTAWQRCNAAGRPDEFGRFCEQEAGWLDDFALFITCKRHHDGTVWSDWPKKLRNRDQKALQAFAGEHQDAIEQIKFEQWLFHRQWLQVKEYAHQKNIKIFGDIPIYVNYDSVDTWANTWMFKLNRQKRPTVVSGVPPDYFSTTGQLWGNPVYDWEKLREEGYQWWAARLRTMFRLFDLVRIDHFRGLVAYWAVPAHHKTAMNGKWVKAPVDDFITTLQRYFPELPLVAEDLGSITADVRKVMKRYEFPGMKVLQFAFRNGSPDDPYLPHNYEENAVVYTGTHDNNTIVGWYKNEATKKDRKRFTDYVGRPVSPERIHWEFIELAWRSKARLAIVPMQDVLGLPGFARMNAPATSNGNWTWRLTPEQLQHAPVEKLATLTEESDRA